MNEKYAHIINLPRHISPTRPQMSVSDRAAQFAPYSALSGYEDAVEETARLTDRRYDLSDTAIENLDRKLRIINENIKNLPVVMITYFVSDERKEGGSYRTTKGTVKKIDGCMREVVMTSGEQIPIDEIAEIDGEIFTGIEF